jgi:peptidoglycan hydrolase CwlO-like protein
MASAAKAYAKQVVKLESQNDLLVTENENLLAANEDLQAQNEELRLKQDRLAACLQDLDRDLSQAFAANFKLSREHDRLRKVIRQANHDWAEWVKTRNQLGKDAEFMRDVVCERFDKIAELEREKKRLQRLVKVLQASRWRSRSRLKRWLVEGENQTAEMESEVTRLKILLNENLEERKAFAEEAWELWDSLVAADTRQAIGDRARKAWSRLSARFTWDSTDSTLCSHKTACTHR